MLHSSAICLFCSDIRDEVSKSHTIVGVFPDNVAVTHIPGGFQKIGIYIRVHAPVDGAPKSLSARLEIPGGEVIQLGGLSLEKIQDAVTQAKNNDSPQIGIIVKALIGNLQVKEAGRIVAIVRLDDEEYIAGTLNVVLSESPANQENSDKTRPLPVNKEKPRRGRASR